MELLFLLLLLLIMYVLLIRPQQGRMKQQRALIASLQAGDEVLTAGGIVGTINVLGDDELRLEVSPGVELRILRGAVNRRLRAAGEPVARPPDEAPGPGVGGGAGDGSDVGEGGGDDGDGER